MAPHTKKMTANNLKQLQHAFSAALLLKGDDEAAALISDSAIPATIRLDIYRNNCVSALQRSLEGIYPALLVLTGAEFFQALCRDYIQQQPPKDSHIMGYGLDLADFLSQHPACQDYPFFIDMARLESAWSQAYSAADHDPLNAEQLAQLAPEEMANIQLQLHPSCRWLTSDFPLSKLWSACLSNQEQELPALDAGGEWLQIIRPQTEVEIRTLTPTAFTFLQLLAADQTLGEAYQQALAVDDQFDLSQTLAAHLEAGTFIGFQTN